MSRKKLLKGVLIAVALLIIVAVFYLFPRLPILTGFAAKNMCSCVFIDNRTPESVKEVDLSFYPVKYANLKVDKEEKYVTASLFGFASKTARYKEGYGCILNSRPDAIQEVAHASLFSAINVSDQNSLDLKDRYKEFRNAVSRSFEDDLKIKGLNTRAVLVLHKGEIIYEAYAPGFSKDSKLITWSVTKSMINALVGILVNEGKIDIHQPVNIPEWQDDERKNITWHHLLQMISGLKWNEDYDDLSDATRMLYKSSDMYAYSIDRPAEAAPGKVWYYSSGTTNILSGYIKKLMNNDAEYLRFPYEKLFHPLSMHEIVMETDGAGNYVGSSYSFATARDLAKFGQLYLDNFLDRDTSGILPKGWAKYSATPAAGSNGNYGAQFWLNAGGAMPDVPRDVFFASGFKGQKIFIVPSHELVVIRLGQTMFDYDFNDFLSEIVQSIEPVLAKE